MTLREYVMHYTSEFIKLQQQLMNSIKQIFN